MALPSSPEKPIPVRTVARSIAEWVGRLGRVWIEGQVTEMSRRPGAGTVFLTLRDPVADVSLRLSCPRAVCDAVGPSLADGARVVVWAQPEFWLARGQLTLTAYDIRPVGVGELLARLERLRTVLAAEGLFAADRKRPLPFLPRAVGLICGRGSAAERDVLEHARRRWPAVRFEVRAVAVQGVAAVTAVSAAVRELDRSPDVDVIVIARGGGSVEDLLPFSDESLCRLVAGCLTPVVAAIGHEQDAPLLDLVADVRASTPTDAGKLVVPDVAEENARIGALRQRAHRALAGRLDRELAGLAALRTRPVLADPGSAVAARGEAVAGLVARGRRAAAAELDRAHFHLGATSERLTALSPAGTLARGYAVLQRGDGSVVREPAEVTGAERLTARLAGGPLQLVVAGEAGGSAA